MSEPDLQAVGVDFGTSTSMVAQRLGLGRVEVLPLGHRAAWLPSVASGIGGLYVVGEDADALPPDRIIFSAKRAITKNRAKIRVGAQEDGEEVDADEVILALLKEIDKRARRIGLPLADQPVLRFGCPAIWGRAQRNRLLDLTREAKLPTGHATLVDEPVAAGVAWLTAAHLTRPVPVEGRLLVFDMGGGTLDIAVLDVHGGMEPSVAVLACSGVPEAGDALDEKIAAGLQAQLGLDLDALRDPPKAKGALRRGAREAKIRLSERETYPVVLSPTFFGTRVPALRYSRAELEQVFAPQLADAEQYVWHALRLARLAHIHGDSTQDALRADPDELAKDVHYVLLAGGMSQVPMVRRRMRELFAGAEVFDDAGLAPDLAVVAGLADTVGYRGVSMPRPSFDFLLEYSSGEDMVVLYEAYTPLHEPWTVQTGQLRPGRETRVEAARLPQQGDGCLRVRTPDGQPVALVDDLTGRPVDGLGVRFGRHDVVLKLYPDGRVLLTEGTGDHHELRVGAWKPTEGAGPKPSEGRAEEPNVYYPATTDH